MTPNSVNLVEAKNRVANSLVCSLDEAEAWLLERFRRAELRAWCEWGYAVEPQGAVVYGQELSREPWILSDRINWEGGQVHVMSQAARELRFASGVYLDCKDLRAEIDRLSPPAQPHKPPSKGGNPGKWDWERAAIQMARYAHLNDESVPERSKLNKLVAEWFVQTVGNQPSESDIRSTHPAGTALRSGGKGGSHLTLSLALR